MAFEFFDKAKEIMGKLESTQAENIHNAALLISESIRNGGFSRHSEADILMRGRSKYADVPVG